MQSPVIPHGYLSPTMAIQNRHWGLGQEAGAPASFPCLPALQTPVALIEQYMNTNGLLQNSLCTNLPACAA